MYVKRRFYGNGEGGNGGGDGNGEAIIIIAGETDSDCYGGDKEYGDDNDGKSDDGDDSRDRDDGNGVGDDGDVLERAIMEMVMTLVADVKERTMMQILMEMMVRPMMVKAVKTKMAMNDGDCDDSGGDDVDVIYQT